MIRSKTKSHLFGLVAGLFATFIIGPSTMTARASTQNVFSITIQQHTFQPNSIKIRQNQPFTIHVTNNGNHPEEFESYDLEFEIIILPHHSINVPIRPLPPGSYEFFGDFHPRTAKGSITVLP
ncbi:MAG: cupredoxin domain-containing protein [Leptospirales bacterium]